MYTISAEILEVSVRYAIADNGYDWADPSAEKTWTVTKGEQVAITAPTVEAIEYTITYMYAGAELQGLTPTSFTVAETKPLPTVVELPDGAEFQIWTNALGDAVNEIKVGTTGNQTFYAQTKPVIPPTPEEDIGNADVDGYDKLTIEQKALVDAAIKEIEDAGYVKADIDAWVADYGKMDPTELVTAWQPATSIEFNLPLLAKEPEVTVAQDGDAFTFVLNDGEDVNVAKAKVDAMLKYSADLSSFSANTEQLQGVVQEDNVTIKATFLKPNDETKGFMKLELTK